MSKFAKRDFGHKKKERKKKLKAFFLNYHLLFSKDDLGERNTFSTKLLIPVL